MWHCTLQDNNYRFSLTEINLIFKVHFLFLVPFHALILSGDVKAHSGMIQHDIPLTLYSI